MFIDEKEWSRYKTGETYDIIKPHSPQVAWKDVIWNKECILKNNFLVWLVNLNMIPTKDSLLSWGLQVDPNCLLCASTPESRNHLFFFCNYSWNL